MQPNQFPAPPLYWTVSYIDGTTVKGTTLAQWLAAPARHVLTVTQVFDATYVLEGVEYHYTVRCAYADYYWMTADGLVNGGQAPAVPNDLPVGATKIGGWTTREAMNAAYNATLQDPTTTEVAATLAVP